MIDRRSAAGGLLAALLAAPAVAARGDRSALRAQVDAFAAAQRFSGVVLHARGGRADFAAAYGLADIAARVPVTLATRFKVGSVSKRLTAVAVLRLVEQGRLDLDAPVTRYLPDFRADTGARITLRRMLSNTSGLFDALNAAMRTDPAIRASTAGSAEMVRRYAGGDIVFEPGTQFDYNIINWVIVHAVLERVTGLPFARVLERLVFAPLGLRDAGLVDTVTPTVPRLAVAHDAAGVAKVAPVPPFGSASGNVYLTAPDAARAAHGIFSTRLLSARSRAALTGIAFAPEDYTLGGRVKTIAGRQWTWDAGKVQGYRAMIAHDADADRTIVILNASDLDQGVIAAQTEAMATVV